MFWGARFSMMYMPTSPDDHPETPRWRTDTRSSYNFATENDVSVISAAAAMF